MWRPVRFLWAGLGDLFRPEMSKAELDAQLGVKTRLDGAIKIVALMAGQQDRELLTRLAIEHKWVLYFTSTCGEAWDALNESKAAIILCDRDLPATEWRDVIQMMAASAHQAYTILVSKVADDYLWNEVIRRGGHDLLLTPLREEDVLRAIRFAWPYWRSSLKYTTKTDQTL